jgi:hypothetical protein
MRLDFRNIGKGLEAIAGAKKARDLAQESARYDVTEGAYGPGLQENIQQLEGLRAGVADPAQNSYDPQQLAAYDQAIGELTRRQGLTAPDFSVASGAQNYGTRQEARQAAAPMRAEGLAGVYRQYGDVAQADALEARAYEQQRALAREGREVQDFATRQAAAQQQGLLTGAKLTELQRTQNLQAALDARLADINQQQFEKPEMRTQAILSLVEELQGPQAAAQLRANYTQQELNDISLQSKKFEEGYRQSRAKGVFSAMEWFDEQNAAFKLERDPKNPFRVIQVNQDGSRQLFADAKNERELGMIVDAKAKPGGWLELAKFDLDQKKADAAIRASDSTVGLRGQQMQMLTNQAAGNAEAQQIRAQYSALTPEEQAGPKGQGLIRDFNMANAKAGMAVPLGAAPRAERPALSEADATARAKAIVESKEVGPTGKRLTFMEALDIVRGTPPAPGTPAAARAQIDALLGSGVDPLAPPAAAARPTTGLQTQPAPARDAPVAPNPYVDARGRPLAVAPAGAPSIASTAIPAAVSAVEGAVGTQAAATRYLQAKIARNEPLSPAERARAQQMGLIR